MTPIEEVEERQAQLDLLYARLAERAGEPRVDAMLLLLRVSDHTLAEARKLALQAEASPQNIARKPGRRRLN
jgi:hypothetical protein